MLTKGLAFLAIMALFAVGKSFHFQVTGHQHEFLGQSLRQFWGNFGGDFFLTIVWAIEVISEATCAKISAVEQLQEPFYFRGKFFDKFDKLLTLSKLF